VDAMSETPLILGVVQMENLRALRERAAAMPVDMSVLLRQLNAPGGRERHIERMMQMFTVEIPTAYQVSFSIEFNHPVGTCRHMSMSSRRAGRTPTPAAVLMVAHELGFVDGFEACKIWTEDIGILPNGTQQIAINLVQPLSVGEAHYA
jgi:hypothetical protein